VIKFQATLNPTIRLRKTVTFKRFQELQDDDRAWYYSLRKKVFQEILPPIENPKINELRKKLKKQKVKFVEYKTFDGLIVFKT
jgi:hypothetical protein